jgi:hypothetical protein
VLRRVCETFLGGVRFPKSDQKISEIGYIYVLQAIILVFPYGVAMIFDTIRTSTDLIFPILFAASIAPMVLLLHCMGSCAAKNGASVVVGAGDDEEEVDFDGCIQASTCAFVCAQRGWKKMIGRSLAAAVLCFQAVDVLGWKATSASLGQPGATMVHIGAWWAVLVALYSLGAHAPAEPSLHALDLGPISRAFHLVSVLTPLQLHMHTAVEIAGWVSSILYAVVAMMPLLWVCGSLPPLDAAVPWLAEQLSVHLHGTSPSASPGRLGVALLGAWAALALVWIVSQASLPGAVTMAAALGALLSMGWLPVVRLGSDGGRDVLLRSRFYGSCGIGARLACGGLPPVVFAVLAAADSTAGAGEGAEALALAMLGVRGAVAVWSHLQQPYLARVVQNCCYKALARRAHAPVVRALHGWLLTVMRLGTSFALQILLTIDTTASIGASGAVGLTLIDAVLVARALRLAWQAPVDCATELGVAVAIGKSALGDLGLGARLFVIGLCISRSRDFLAKVQFVFAVLGTSWSSAGQRNSFNTCVHILLTMLLPVWLAMAAIAAALGAPLLPLLGAPCFILGYPRPLWHAPPSRQTGKDDEWAELGDVEKGFAPVDADKTMYKQLLPPLFAAVLKTYNRGGAGGLRPGDMLVARYEDLIGWVRCHEAGYGYVVLSLAGLELKVTSCHNVEGLRLDEVLAAAALTPGPGAAAAGSCHNTWAGHLLLPIAACEVRTYSDSPTSLTGIIDSRDALAQLPGAFMKCLVWSFAAEGAVLRGTPPAMRPGSQQELATATALFPRAWADTVAARFRRGGAGSRFAGQDLQQLAAAGFLAGGGLDMLPESGVPVSAHGRTISAVFQLPVKPAAGSMALDAALPAGLGGGAGSSPELQSVAASAYRLGFKLVYDVALHLLPGPDLEGGSADLEEVLVELSDPAQWHLGPTDNCSTWSRRMLDGTTNLFTVGPAGGGRGTVDQGEGGISQEATGYAARLLQLRPVEVLLGKLNSAAVRGIWAGLSHELLYLGSDDDERYSIQANTQMLRNITIEAAPPAIGGYPLFVSGNVECSTGSSHAGRQSTGEKSGKDGRKPPPAAGVEPAVPDVPKSSGGSELPYGGDIGAAMRAQDRAAIRQIMAARDADSAVAPAAPAPEIAAPAMPHASTPSSDYGSRVAVDEPATSPQGLNWMDSVMDTMPDELDEGSNGGQSSRASHEPSWMSALAESVPESPRAHALVSGHGANNFSGSNKRSSGSLNLDELDAMLPTTTSSPPAGAQPPSLDAADNTVESHSKKNSDDIDLDELDALLDGV